MRVLTLNVLCPDYFRIGGGEYERARPRHAQERFRRLAALLRAADADLVCLQEYSFDPTFLRIFEEALAQEYDHALARRPCRKQDGLALWYRRASVTLLHQRRVDLYDLGAGNRTALLVALDVEGAAGPLLLTNVHLTFPHSEFDRQLRLAQMGATLRALDEFVADCELDPSAPRLLVGDLNDVGDAVYELATQEHGYVSTFGRVHGREAIVTHANHAGQQVGVDFVLLADPSDTMRPVEAAVLPATAPDDEAMDRPRFETPLQPEEPPALDEISLEQWSRLTDHRAIVVDLEFAASAGSSD